MRYHNFDLWIEGRTAEGYPLRAVSDIYGEARALAHLAPDASDLLHIQQRLAQRETDRQFLVDSGTFLYSSLFSPSSGDIEALYERCCGDVLEGTETGIRLRLRIDSPEMATVPWEFLYAPRRQGFLGASIHTPVVRYLELFAPIRGLETAPPLNMLVVIPNSPGLQTAAEKTTVLQALAGLEEYVQCTVLEGNVTCTRVSDSLLEERFHIFHFVGHGHFQDDRAFLELNTNDEQVDYVDHVQFGSLFLNHPTMKLVVLNACKGAEVSASRPLVGLAPELVKQGIPAVVAMQYAIYDDVAILFAREFYQALFKGWASGRVEVAMSHARNRLTQEFPDERALGTPVLFMRAREGVLFDLVTGKYRRDLPFSRKLWRRSAAVAREHTQNLDILQAQQRQAFDPDVHSAISNEQAELARLRQRLRFRNIALITTCGVAFLIFFLSVMRVLDIFTLDTKMESYVIWFGDLFTQKSISADILLVALNEQDEQYFNKPFDQLTSTSWRHEHAQLVDRLSRSGTKVIAFDFSFSTQSPYDDAFSQAVQQARQAHGTSVIFGISDFPGGAPGLLPALRDTAQSWGILCIGKRLGYARIAPLAILQGGQSPAPPAPSLALATFAAYQHGHILVDRDMQQINVLDESMRHLEKIDLFELEDVSLDQDRCPAIPKGATAANAVIDLSPLELWRSPRHRLTYSEVMTQATPEKAERFKDKIILVGVEKDGHDAFSILRGLRREQRFGLELHADAVNMLLRGVAIRALGQWGQLGVIFCLGTLGACIRYWVPQTMRFWRLCLAGVVLLVYALSIVYVYSQYRILCNSLYHVWAFWLTYWAVGKVERRWFG